MLRRPNLDLNWRRKPICENFKPAAARPENCFIVDLESHPAVIVLLRGKFFSISLRNYSIRSRNRGEKVGEKHQDKIFFLRVREDPVNDTSSPSGILPNCISNPPPLTFGEEFLDALKYFPNFLIIRAYELLHIPRWACFHRERVVANNGLSLLPAHWVPLDVDHLKSPSSSSSASSS